MKMKFSKWVLALGSSLICLAAAHAGVPNNDDTTTFLGPTLKGKFTNTVTDNTAFSILGEAGLRNFRLGGTLGWKLDENQRFKISADYLYQRITYSFFSGNTDEWVNQGSIGAAYLYEFNDYAYYPALGVKAFLSHAPSDSLSTVTGTFVRGGVLIPYVDQRRIAGSNAGGISPNVSFMPWDGGRLGLELNYDNVRYDRNFSGGNATGFGGTVNINQIVSQDVMVGASAAVRKPFNNYAAYLNWSNVPYLGSQWSLGLDGDYTVGKEDLPNTYNVSLGVNYALDQRCPRTIMQRNLKGDVKGDVKGERAVQVPIVDDLMAWTADPAVYLPQVLAVTDEDVTTGCRFGVPAFSGTIPNQSTAGGGTPVSLNTAAFFTGTNLTFSITQSAAPAPGNTLSINPTTGVLSATGPSTQTITVTVIATNPCGSATSNSFNINY